MNSIQSALKTLPAIAPIVASIIAFTLASPVAQAKDFKGTQTSPDFTVGVVTGLGLVGLSPGFPVHITASKRLVANGFAEDINNSVHLELEAGPTFSVSTPIFYSAHLRWDFVKDDQLTFFGMGGLSGLILPATITLNPRFGIGAFYKLQRQLALRAEIAHDTIGVGVTFFID